MRLPFPPMPKSTAAIYPVVLLLTADEHAALAAFTAQIMTEVTVSSVARYLICDYLASELGFDLVVPSISGQP